MTRAAILYLSSFVAHAALAVGVVSLKGERTHENIAISVVESKKPKNKPVDAPPPPPPPPREEKKAKVLSTPQPPKIDNTPPPPSNDNTATADAPDFGLSLGNGPPSTGGLAVAAAKSGSDASDHVSKKLLGAPQATAKPSGGDECVEAIKKPKVISITQPSYTSDAREAGVAGKVRIEVTVDAHGNVASARVLEGLGHGLDESALAAARSATFEAGTKCGKPTSTTFVIAIRFSL
jgi:protein TonB